MYDDNPEHEAFADDEPFVDAAAQEHHGTQSSTHA
jgi:hypothetical protein